MSVTDQTLNRLNIPRNEEGPVFDEPWQAQAFALTLKLVENGHFSWGEWAELLGAEITTATKQGCGCGNEDYYLCWLAALEKIVTAKKILSKDQLAIRKEQWRCANEHTDFGKPIKLSADVNIDDPMLLPASSENEMHQENKEPN